MPPGIPSLLALSLALHYALPLPALLVVGVLQVTLGLRLLLEEEERLAAATTGS